MSAAGGPVPYVLLPGTAGEALAFWAGLFGCGVRAHSFADVGRTDGPQDAVAHGYLVDGPVALFAADAAAGEPALHAQGLMLALLGTAAPDVLRTWFAGLSEGGRVVDDLQARGWGAHDGQVVDRYGVHWLVGYEEDPPATG